MQVNKTLINDSMSITFSIIAKIFLPKFVSETTSRMVSKWLREKSPYQIFAQNITKLVEKYKVVHDSWLIITDRKNMNQVPEFLAVYETVSLFEANRAPRQLLFSFITMVVQSVNIYSSKKSFITQILPLSSQMPSGITISKLMEYALKLYDIIPKLYTGSHVNSNENSANLENQEEEGHEVPQKPVNPFLSKRITPSYIKANIEPSKNPLALITNNITKSLASGSEAQTNERISESLRFIAEMRYHMFTVFESFVRADQAYRALLYKCSMDGILYRNAIQVLYGPYANEILRYPPEAVIPVARKRCVNEMEDIFDFRTTTEYTVDIMTKQMPVFDYSPAISFSTRAEPFKFHFSARSKLVADILSRLGHTHSPDFVHFLATLMPLLVLTRKGERICIIGTDTICNALFLFSRCADAIDKFFSPEIGEDSTLDDILRAAECEASLKFSSVTNTRLEEFLEDFIKKFSLNDYNKFTEWIYQAEDKYGFSSKHIFTLVMYVTKLDALCSRFAAQFKLKKIAKLAKFYSRECGPDAKKRLDARFRLYKQSVEKVVISPLVKIEMCFGDEYALITPI